MAREKMSSNTADEAAASNEERPSAPTCRSNIPVKKKLSNKRSGEMAGGGGNELSANSGTYQSFGRKGSGCNGGSTGSNFTHTGFKGATQRGNKTLGWYLNDGLFTTTSNDSHSSKNNSERGSASPPAATDTVAEMKDASHRDITHMEDEKKRGKRIRQRPPRKMVDLKTRADSIGNSDDIHDAKPAPRNEHSKDDYWYYDPTSDGFYYENMGSRGWRRRLPVSAQKRLKMEQEMYAAFLRDPSQFACYQADLYGFGSGMGAMNAVYYAPQIKYYDPASDGYYFEMPSVDGWKKRQPNSSSTSSSGSGSGSSTSGYKGGSFMRSAFLHQESPQVTSYGAALARGQLPPAYTLADSAVGSQDPFSSGASSMSTLSSLSEGTPTPPPRTQFSTSNGNSSSLFPDDENLTDYLAEQYDRALQLNEVISDDSTNDIASSNPASLQLPSYLFQKTEPVTYGDVAATSCDVEDLENRPPNNELECKRPGTLHLRTPLEDETTNGSDLKENKKRTGHELLLNFNADKFIADIAYYGSNVERVLRDLAALKTPVTSSTVCSADSPHTPAVYNTFPDWAKPSEGQTNTSDEWWLGETAGAYIDDIWSRGATSCSNAKSKLSIWRDAELLTAVPCDNN